MQHSIKKLPKSALEITIEVTPEEMQPYLQKAALRLSQETTIPGFRVGKAPYEEVRARLGAGRIWEEAATIAVPKVFSDIVREEKIETLGSPAIEVDKLAPDNAFIFKATVPLMPEVTLGDFASLKIEKKSTEATDAKVDKVIEDLRKMQTRETVVNRAALPKGDKVVLDMTMSLDSVPLDGGQARDHSIYMDEEYYIPGLMEEIVGLSKGDVKEFKLKFPKDHYQKMTAGRDVDFKVTIKDVYELQKPDIDDEFAKKIGKTTIAEVKGLIRENLAQEAQTKEQERREIALLEQSTEKTKFGDIPDVLVNEETVRMMQELENGVAQQGMETDEYLKKIKKTRDELRLGFAGDAVKRVKTGLMMRKIVLTQNIEITEDELDAEVTRVLEVYKDAPEQHEQIRSDAARDYLRGVLRNRKAIEWLKEQAKI